MLEQGDGRRRRRKNQTRKSMVSARTISPKPWLRPPRPQSNPWSVHTDGKDSQIFYSVSKQRSYTKSIDELKGRYIFNCSQDGWLVICGSRSDDCLLLNPVSMETINLPTLSKNCFEFCILTSPPHDGNCFVVFTDENRYTLYICKLGDSEWTKQVINSEEYSIESMVSGNQGGRMLYALVKLVDSKFLCYTLVMFHMAPDLTLRLERIVDRHELPTSFPETYEYLNFLVNCYEDGIFLVMYRVYEGKARGFCSVEVAKRNFSNQDWEIVDTLGGRAFFVNGSGHTLWCWAEGEIKANCVYFRGDGPTNLCVFDVEDKSMSFPSMHLSLDSAFDNRCWVVTAHNVNAKPSRKFSKFSGFRVKNRKLSTLLLK